MPDLNRRIISCLDKKFGGEGVWDIIPGQPYPPVPVCDTYPTALAGYDALVAAGFRPTRFAVAAPPFEPAHDRTTVTRYEGVERGIRVLVLLVRRAACDLALKADPAIPVHDRPIDRGAPVTRPKRKSPDRFRRDFLGSPLISHGADGQD